MVQLNALLALLTQRFSPCCTNLSYGQSWNTRFQSGVLILSRTSMLLSVYLALNQRKGEMSYEDRCQLLNWPTLCERRTYLSLVECYKIVFSCYHLKFEDFFEFTTTKSSRAKHPYKLYVKPARLNCYKNSFFIRIVKHWNSLPRDIVEAESLQLFKSKLKSHMNI